MDSKGNVVKIWKLWCEPVREEYELVGRGPIPVFVPKNKRFLDELYPPGKKPRAL